MIPVPWQKGDWPHGCQGDTDRPLNEVFTQHSVCQCIKCTIVMIVSLTVNRTIPDNDC